MFRPECIPVTLRWNFQHSGEKKAAFRRSGENSSVCNNPVENTVEIRWKSLFRAIPVKILLSVITRWKVRWEIRWKSGGKATWGYSGENSTARWEIRWNPVSVNRPECIPVEKKCIPVEKSRPGLHSGEKFRKILVEISPIFRFSCFGCTNSWNSQN